MSDDLSALPFADLQPKDGETVVICDHLVQGRWHWYYFPDHFGLSVSGTNSAGERVTDPFNFVGICNDCYLRLTERSPEGSPLEDLLALATVPIVWVGDDPEIRAQDPPGRKKKRSLKRRH